MLRVGLVGLPNAGKSTLFNLLTDANALVAPYPFSTVTPNKANLKLYDTDAEQLATAVKAPDIQRTEIEVWDIAGLIEKASEGEGLGNEFLGQIKDCDLLVHVVRLVKESTAQSVAGHIQVVAKEIALFDHKCLQKPFEKARRMARLYPHDTQHTQANRIFSKAYDGTKDGKPIFDVLTAEEMKTMHEVGLVSAKPRMILCNSDDPAASQPAASAVASDLEGNLLELATLAAMPEADRVFLGYSSEQVYAFLQAFCSQLVLHTGSKRFYTVGHLGVGQWAVPKSADARACAELVHDSIGEALKIVKVANLQDFMHLGSWQELTKQGLVKKYGPTHIPGDKDVLYFEVN